MIGVHVLLGNPIVTCFAQGFRERLIVIGIAIANAALAWQQKEEQNATGAFPFRAGSYNSGRPYEIAIVAPEGEKVENPLDFSPGMIGQLLYDGCVAADR